MNTNIINIPPVLEEFKELIRSLMSSVFSCSWSLVRVNIIIINRGIYRSEMCQIFSVPYCLQVY